MEVPSLELILKFPILVDAVYYIVNTFGAKFQTTFVCICILTNYRLERRLYVKLKDWMSNSIYPDETAHLSRLIWIYTVCKSLLLSPVAVKELNSADPDQTARGSE